MRAMSVAKPASKSRYETSLGHINSSWGKKRGRITAGAAARQHFPIWQVCGRRREDGGGERWVAVSRGGGGSRTVGLAHGVKGSGLGCSGVVALETEASHLKAV